MELVFRFDQRRIRNGKRKTRDDHVGKRLARKIDAAPKTVGPKKHAPRCGLELFEQFAPWRAAALHQEIHSLLRKKFLHFTGHLLHVAVAGEKNESAPVGFLDEMRDPAFQFFLISGVARVGHFLHDKYFHLLLKIEWTAN